MAGLENVKAQIPGPVPTKPFPQQTTAFSSHTPTATGAPDPTALPPARKGSQNQSCQVLWHSPAQHGAWLSSEGLSTTALGPASEQRCE